MANDENTVKGFAFDYRICDQDKCAYCRVYGVDCCVLHSPMVMCPGCDNLCSVVGGSACDVCTGGGKITLARYLDGASEGDCHCVEHGLYKHGCLEM